MVFRGVISYRSFFEIAESLVILGVVFFFCSYSGYAQAGQVSLAWGASPGAAGYQLSYGPSSGNYTGNFDCGNTTSCTLTLQDGKYYIAAKAYNSGKTSWSGFSNEVVTTISTSSTAPTASFSATPTSGPAPLTVTFTDSSSGNITGRSWDFNGDGTTDSTATSGGATTYTNPGAYTAKLTVTGPGGSNTASKTISVTAAPPVANFSATPTSGMAPLTVQFTNSSTNATSYLWTFGDGGTSSVENPSHIYTTAGGTYAVSLTAMGAGGASDIESKSSYITVAFNSGGGGSTAGLVGAYNFEEASGTTVADASSQGNKGTIRGATRITTGRFGKALFFDGVNDWVTVNDAASLDLTTKMTLEAWVYPTEDMSGWDTVLVKERSGGSVYYLYANSPTSQPGMGVFIGAYRNLRGGTWLLRNTWTHLAATYDGTTERLYVNGTQVAQRPQTGPIQVSSGPLRLGGNSVWGEFFKGRIDEVRIYNRALSATEIQTDKDTSIATSSPPVTLEGTKILGSVTDSNSQGKAEAFRTTAATTGMVTSLSVYVDSGSTATQLVAGLYTDNDGHPGTLLEQGTLTSPVAGSWNKVLLPATSVNAGSTYWIATLSPSGVLRFRAAAGSTSQPSETSAQTTLSTLPGTWSTGTASSSGPLSAYGAGYK